MWNSIRFRFAAAGLATTLLLVIALGFVLQGAYERHSERTALEELKADLRFLTRALRVEGESITLEVDPLPDPRFQEPFSGLYWQVHDDRTGRIERSPSLATFTLALPPDELALGDVHRHILDGPEGSKLIVLERRIPEGNGIKSAFRFAVAIDRSVISLGYRSFMQELMPVLALIALGFLAAMTMQATFAMVPLQKTREALHLVRSGARERIGDSAAQELAGLAADFDLLLNEREGAVKKAREQAANLAHGLKTPLTILNAKTRALRLKGDAASADELDAVISDLDARLSRELARAQIQGPSPQRAPVAIAALAKSITDSLARTELGDDLEWRVDIDSGFLIAIDRTDAMELLGALVDNAAKWAKTMVRVSAGGDAQKWTLWVDDDGPGIAPQNRRAALIRGEGLDPERSGSGLGLAIVQDIAAAYGARLVLEDSPLGGLRARIISGSAETLA